MPVDPHILPGYKGILIRPLLAQLGARWDPRAHTWLLPSRAALSQAEQAAQAATASLVQATSRSIARHLLAQGCTRRGDELRFSCPAHQDDQPSASFHTVRAVWHCFGCGARGGALGLARTLGLPVPTSGELLSDSSSVPVQRHCEAWEPTVLGGCEWTPSVEPDSSTLRLPRIGIPQRAYEVRDGEGRLFAVHARFQQQYRKLFRWWRNGAWNLGGLPVAAAPLWGSERLVRSLRGQPVYVTEGEKAAAALVAAGALALGTVTGAAGTPGEAPLSVLHGRRVILWPDADDVGRAHMARIAALLDGRCEIKTVATGSRSDGFDAADFVEARSGGLAYHQFPEYVEVLRVD